MQSRWFLLGATIGFIILLFKIKKLADLPVAQEIRVEQATTVAASNGGGGCGCGGTKTASYGGAPSSSNPGGGGFSYGTQQLGSNPYPWLNPNQRLVSTRSI